MHRHVFHHLSLAPLALRLGNVKKTGKRGSLLVGNGAGEFYSLVPFRAAAHTKSLQALHAIGGHLNTLPIPHTNADWLHAQRLAVAATGKLKCHTHTVSLATVGASPPFRRDAAPWDHVVEGHQGLGFKRVRGGNDTGPEQVVAHVDV